MKTILYLHAGAEMYGADKILLELVTGLDPKKYRPIVVLPTDGVLKKALLDHGIETYVVSYPILRRKYFNPKGIWQYATTYLKGCKQILQLLADKEISVDIIHINTTAVLEGIYLRKKLRAKLVWHVHEILLKPKVVANFIHGLVKRYSDQVVVVSKAVRDHLVTAGIPANKIQVIYNGIDTKRFKPGYDVQYLYDEWAVPADAIKIGMIGRVNAWKGQDDFLAAIKELLKHPNYHFFIIGSAFSGQEWRVTELNQKINQLPGHERIHYSPYRKDTAELDDFFDLLVLPSTNPDPLPTVVLEAMSSGTPVVGYNHGGVTEMVEDGESGFLAEVRNPIDLAGKIQLAVDTGVIDLGQAARQRVLNHFSQQNFISKFEHLYQKLS